MICSVVPRQLRRVNCKYQAATVVKRYSAVLVTASSAASSTAMGPAKYDIAVKGDPANNVLGDCTSSVEMGCEGMGELRELV